MSETSFLLFLHLAFAGACVMHVFPCTCDICTVQCVSLGCSLKAYIYVIHPCANIVHMYTLIFRSSEPALDWAEHLTLPTRFSIETSGAIESGILTKKSRVEIHNSIATLMLVYTSRPTSNDRDITCRRLIQKYPTLKDSSDSGYVSYSLPSIHAHESIDACTYMPV